MARRDGKSSSSSSSSSSTKEQQKPSKPSKSSKPTKPPKPPKQPKQPIEQQKHQQQQKQQSQQQNTEESYHQRQKQCKEKEKEKEREPQKQTHQKPKKCITDYFPRTKRVPFKVLAQQEEKKIKHHLVHNCDPDGFKIIDLEDKGKGIVALNKISKGSFVCEYSGDLIKITEAKAREQEYEKEKFGCYMYFFDWNNRRYCVDATKPTGRIGRLINHSRKVPNLKTKVFAINDVPHLIFIALRDIEPGEELLYDYGERNKDAIAAHPWLVTS